MLELAQRPADQDVQLPSNHTPWTVLILAGAAQFMVILDVTVVNVALPSIARDLRFAPADLQWVVTAYLLMTGGFLLLGGRAADLLGSRSVFMAGLLVFAGASLASGLASAPLWLIGSRAAQGFGAALLSPAALSIVTAAYSGEQRTRALSVWGAIGAGGAAAGVLLGGVLTSYLGWRSVFFINVPVGLVAAAFALRVAPRMRGTAASWRDLDLGGALTVVSGLALLVYSVESTTSFGWGSPRILALFAPAAVLLAAFFVIEHWARRPLISPDIWRVRSLISSAVVQLGATGILIGAFFLNSLLLQNLVAASPLETGLAFLPLVVVTGIAAHIGPRLLMRIGSRSTVVAGLLVMASGDLLLARTPAQAAYFIDLFPAFLLLGFGVGLTFVSVTVTAMSDVHTGQAGLASGLMTTAHEIGGAFGVSIFSVVALGAGTEGAVLAQGYRQGALTGAAIAAVIALIALASVPAFRPATAEGARLH